MLLAGICFSQQLQAESADLILIEKAKRVLKLIKGGKQIAQYSIALGGEPVAAKHCQGDNKTPEGEYSIIARNLKSSYYRSLQISYPNQSDRKIANQLGCAPGGDIMIHGLPNGRGWLGAAHRLHDWTLGCIALTNSEIDQIWKWVPIGTKVRIMP